MRWISEEAKTYFDEIVERVHSHMHDKLTSQNGLPRIATPAELGRLEREAYLETEELRRMAVHLVKRFTVPEPILISADRARDLGITPGEHDIEQVEAQKLLRDPNA